MTTTLRRAPLGALMLAARRAARMSQHDVAWLVDCTTSHVSAMERGQKTPTPDMLARLLDALSVPAGERDHWYAAAGVLPAAMERRLMEHPERWVAVREVLE